MTSYYPFIVLFASIFIIILAFFTTRLLSGGYKQSVSNKNLKFIEKLPLSVDKSLVLVQLENHFYLMYVGKNGAQLIDKLDSLELNETIPNSIAFNDILEKFKKK